MRSGTTALFSQLALMTIGPITICESDFFARVEVAASTGVLLDLTNENVHLTNVIRLKRSGILRIKNGIITSVASTIFSLGTDRKLGPPALSAEGTTLIHNFECPDNESPYAAVFVQGKARVELTDVTIISQHGFGLWSKHDSHALLQNCNFVRAGKSVIACFNKSRLDITDCTIACAGVHGICARGTSHVNLTNCIFTDCAHHALALYQQGCVSLNGCHISKTRNPSTSAIYAEALDVFDAASIKIIKCRIFDNAGTAINLRGKVTHNLDEDDCGNDVEGVVTVDVPGEDKAHQEHQEQGVRGFEATCEGGSQPLVPTLSEEEFHKLVEASLKTKSPVDLTGHVVTVTRPIGVPKHKHLAIVNGTFIGDCHSIFSVDTPENRDHRGNGDTHVQPLLSLDGTTLLHLFFTAEKRGIGAAIFVQGTARVALTRVSIKSEFGFGLWMKHEGRAVLKDCVFSRAGRSGIACFNNSRVDLCDCSITHAEVHGICVRGTCRVIMTNCQLRDCGTRAAFVYQQGSLSLTDCCISETRSALTPAIHAEAAGAKDCCFLSLVRCRVFDNAGPSVVIAGKAVHEFLDNDFDERSPPIFALDVSEATIPRPWAALQSEYNAVLLS